MTCLTQRYRLLALLRYRLALPRLLFALALAVTEITGSAKQPADAIAIADLKETLGGIEGGGDGVGTPGGDGGGGEPHVNGRLLARACAVGSREQPSATGYDHAACSFRRKFRKSPKIARKNVGICGTGRL